MLGSFYLCVCACTLCAAEHAHAPSSMAACDSFDATRDANQMQTSFIQSRALLTKRVPMPITFVHTPKTAGNQFIYSLIALPSVCTKTEFDVAMKDLASNLLRALSYNVSCSGFADMNEFGIPFGSHDKGFGAVYSDFFAGPPAHGFILFRQPEQRIVSQYNMHLGLNPDYDTPIKEYAQARAGCVVKLLTTSLERPCSDPYPAPSDDSVSLAVQRLRDGFAFVGLVEEYDLSVCLLHAMFGGECSSVELTSVHLGNRNSTLEAYDTSELENWTDVPDGVLYSEAADRFRLKLQTYGVSEQSCQACWAAAR